MDNTICDDRRIIRVYQIIETFRLNTIEEQIEDVKRKLGAIRPETLEAKTYEKFGKVNDETILATLVGLKYNVQPEGLGQYFGMIRGSEIYLDSNDGDLIHKISWQDKGEELPIQSRDQTLANLIQIATNADNKFAGQTSLIKALMGLKMSGGTNWFHGILDVNGKEATVDVEIKRQNGQIEFQYIAQYR